MKCTASNNGQFSEIAAVSQQKRQCEFGSYYPARTLVKPLPRQAAGTLSANATEVRTIKNEHKIETESYN